LSISNSITIRLRITIKFTCVLYSFSTSTVLLLVLVTSTSSTSSSSNLTTSSELVTWTSTYLLQYLKICTRMNCPLPASLLKHLRSIKTHRTTNKKWRDCQKTQ